MLAEFRYLLPKSGKQFKGPILRNRVCAADFSLLNLPKGKSLGRSKPSSYAQAPQHTVWETSTRGGHRHLQIGRMLDIDLKSEPPHAPSPQIYVSKVWESGWPEVQEEIQS
jgi:hypothetical protein